MAGARAAVHRPVHWPGGERRVAARPWTRCTSQRFINDLTALGIPAGTGGVNNNTNPLTNAFVRLDLAIPEWNSTFTLRDNYAHADTRRLQPHHDASR